jgi:ubiquinone/menaquinone biosynthesis C-methylase UbiE
MRPGGLSITEQAFSHCDLPSGARLLDVGCGMGSTLRYITANYTCSGFGVDVSRELLSRACQNDPRSSFARAKSETLPFPDESMDAVISECTLSMFETDMALSECARVLKPDGYFIVSDLYARNKNGVHALRRLPPGTCIGMAMHQAEIVEKIQRCGLNVIIWQDCSEQLKEFSICTLVTAAKVDPFDLHIAAARARLGYYFLVANKCR